MSLVRFAALSLAATFIFAAPIAQAQGWQPTKPIHMIVPFPPGALDPVARPIAVKMSEGLGQPVVVENRPGANGAIGTEATVRAAPDGYTIMIGTTGTHVTAVYLSKTLPYDPIKDFTAIAAAVEPVTCLAIHDSVPANSVSGLIAYAKANPGKLSFGSSGVGSVFHLMGELFQQTTGAQIVHLPYKGVGQAAADLIGGHVPMVFSSINVIQPYLGVQPIKMLAILEPQRFALLPNVPSITETIPAFHKPSSWFGFFGPAGMPKEIVARLNQEIIKALNAPDLRPKLEETGLAIIGDTPEEFQALVKSGIDEYGKIIKTAGIQPE
jgi:tripartite-type tricarboxylate transporter receptor subunit TctC